MQTMNICQFETISPMHQHNICTHFTLTIKVKEGNTLRFHWVSCHWVNLKVDLFVIIQRIMNQFQFSTISHTVTYILITGNQSIIMIWRLSFIDQDLIYNLNKTLTFFSPILNSTMELNHTILTREAFNLPLRAGFNPSIENVHQIFFNQTGSQVRVEVLV